jgi:hypothetical protein
MNDFMTNFLVEKRENKLQHVFFKESTLKPIAG